MKNVTISYKLEGQVVVAVEGAFSTEGIEADAISVTRFEIED